MDIKVTKDILNSGGVVLLPTDTVYGLAASPLSKKAVGKIFELKMRPGSVNLPIMVASIDNLNDLGVNLQSGAKRLFNSKYVPGDLTIILGFAPKPLVPWLNGRDECAIRIPNHNNLLKLLKETGPLLVTSANKHGVNPTPNNVNDILKDLNGEPDLVIDGGIVENIPSTIVNCRLNPPIVERTGRISEQELLKIIHNE